MNKEFEKKKKRLKEIADIIKKAPLAVLLEDRARETMLKDRLEFRIKSLEEEFREKDKEVVAEATGDSPV